MQDDRNTACGAPDLGKALEHRRLQEKPNVVETYSHGERGGTWSWKMGTIEFMPDLQGWVGDLEPICREKSYRRILNGDARICQHF